MYSLSDPRVVFLINKNYNNLIAIYLLLQLLIYYTNIDPNFIQEKFKTNITLFFIHLFRSSWFFTNYKKKKKRNNL